MSDPTPTLAMVGHPAPEFLRMVALGAGLRGGVVPAIVTFREEFRDEEWAAIEAGVSRVVIGTRAAESLSFVADMVREFGGDKIAVGIDAKDGIVSVKGWTEMSKLTAIDFARQVEDVGVETIIYTDIATDGMMQGPNFQELDKMLGVIKCKLIASGGVSSFADVQRLSQHPRIHGAIIGKALYDSAIRLHLVSSSRRLN